MVKYAELIKGAERITPNAHMNYGNPRQLVNRNTPLYYAGTRVMRFNGQIRSDTIPTRSYSDDARQGLYSIEVDFKNVRETDGLNPIEIQQHRFPRPSLSHHDIMVRCSCLNYRFRADWANRHHRASAGARFPNFIPKIFINNDTPMLCKHIMAYVDWLLQNGFVTE